MEYMSKSSRSVLPWIIWIVGAFAYALAVANRSSLSALGPTTQTHFGIDATTLSMFAMIQLIVYAGCQIPVGVLLDRFGAVTLVVAGGLLMVLGQTTMATAGNVWFAIIARVLVGMGDACTFISVMRIIPDWFSVQRIPVISQLTGLIGQVGQLASVTPLLLLVEGAGWTGGFLTVAGIGIVAVVLCIFVLREKPGQQTVVERMTGRRGKTTRASEALARGSSATAAVMAPPPTEMLPVVREYRGFGFWTSLKKLLSMPGVRLGYWVHFSTQFSLTNFVLLWGTPFLTGGMGFSTATAGALLSLVVVSSMIASLVLGPISSRYMSNRVWVTFGIALAIALLWVSVLVWPGKPPMWLLVILLIAMPIGGPASMIAFEVGRSHTPRSYSGFSTGLINTGGFTASLCVILLLGLVLDLQGAGSPENYSLGAFKWAFAVQIPFWLLGLTMIVIERHRTMKWMSAHGRSLW